MCFIVNVYKLKNSAPPVWRAFTIYFNKRKSDIKNNKRQN